ncbi:MAG: DUF2213 domain-containing protein [Spiribacter salinus]|uniref:DUF2213 domain-containing protein n=1 Tax=Spiribacter salinus TaxID=1335746 RepID=A0A540VRV4_9GAMM|nr:MAG: DUF2213 domain-containing protein [Spiribacter salinus]
MTEALRVDFAEQPIRMTMTAEGYLTGEAYVARVGIQAYQDGMGGIRREYRPTSEVFDAASIASFRNKPITMGHPQERLVNSDNARRLSVGYIGENIRPDGDWLVMPLTITDGDTIAGIEDGSVVQLSGGYVAELDETPGEYDGQTYDAVQRSIRGNHVAIVKQGRAGDKARLNLDAADAVAVADTQAKGDSKMSEKTVTVRVDGIEYSVPPEVERHMAKKDEALESVTKERDDAKTEATTAQAKADAAKEELETYKASHNDEAIAAAAKQRVSLERSATKVLGDDAKLDGKSDRDIKVEVVKAVHKNATLDDNTDAAYIDARYDAAMETFEAHGDAMAKQKAKTAPKTDPAPKGDAGDPKAMAEKDVQDSYKKRDRGFYKNKSA